MRTAGPGPHADLRWSWLCCCGVSAPQTPARGEATPSRSAQEGTTSSHRARVTISRLPVTVPLQPARGLVTSSTQMARSFHLRPALHQRPRLSPPGAGPLCSHGQNPHRLLDAGSALKTQLIPALRTTVSCPCLPVLPPPTSPRGRGAQRTPSAPGHLPSSCFIPVSSVRNTWEP